ncbi:Venom dipeptidyl peptidase 4 [Frankliniella fusca]|uniref:Venom dipeptidyl peptidase 4 n=1 Tax=Frankliniella fusca TaxID=407009 RepID=A0AAE1I1L9_9NEOP|nr:Venom dipeptidyl peptidase 4 [Frankliniella fusca]
MAASQRNGSSSHSLEMANSNQELVARGRARRWKWLGLGIAAAVTIAILTTVLVLVLKPDEDEPPAGERLTLEDILSRRFSPRSFNATWISDTELFFDEDSSGYVPVVYDVGSKQKRSLLKNVKLNYSTFQTELSADGKYALESYSYRALYRHSYLAYYNIIEVATGTKRPIEIIPGRTEPVFVQLAEWGPQGSALVVVFGNDIYYAKDAESPLQRVTATGVHDTIYNGVPDWVYEEEVLSSKKALWFSHDGALLAYATYNDSRVPVMTLPYYGRPGDLNFQYTRAVNIRYPKPNTHNPDVTLTVFDTATGTRVVVEPPPSITEDPQQPVLAVTHWVPDTQPRLLTVWMNRVQNHAVVELVTVSGGAVTGRVTLADLKQPKGWIELFEEGVTSLGERARGRVLLPLSKEVGGDSFRHIALLHPGGDGTTYTRTYLTDGAFVVTSILSWDSDNGYVYFVSTAEDDPKRALVQRVKDDPAGAPHKPECLSCSLAECLYATAALSKNNSYIALTCSGPGVPYTSILSLGKEVQKVVDWERNDNIREALAQLPLPTRKSVSVDLPGGFKAQVMLWLPPGADLSGNTKYPMLVDVYGGPNSFRVSERFAMDWGTFLSANKSVIYAAIDGRGSANKGDNTIFSIYHRFGTYEVEDQINVTRHLQNTLKYIDASRTAIWGWSYGGYASAMALAKDTDNVFKCGMSVAPVTDWILYDSIYTERYMGLPTEGDNRAGYTRAQLTNKVENFKNKFFMLVHGTLDDNVHYQQSMMLSRKLEEDDILFRQQSYPDEEHGINFLQPHLYHTLQNFLMECYQKV